MVSRCVRQWQQWRVLPEECRLLLLFILLCFPSLSWQRASLGERALRQLTTSQITTLSSSSDPTINLDSTNPSSHLSHILIPRPPDTENNTIVRNYIISTLKALDWNVEEDSFTESTPYGVKRFTNVIATKDPDASRRVVLAAHFDSKFFPHYPQNQFLGATDSAAPCAMLLDLAEVLNPLLERRKEKIDQGLLDDEESAETTLQLLFLDGEEAFKDWTTTDSVYGARHLAGLWATTYISPDLSRKRRLVPATTEISLIEHLILLDLLGAPEPMIQSYFPDTAWLFDAMVSAESRLASGGFFKNADGLSASSEEWKSFFKPRTGKEVNFGFIDDDHVSFMKQGVSVVHVIASPFPRVWHTLKDDASALDLETMRRWSLILRVFMSEYLMLEPDGYSTARKFNGELD